MLLFEPRQRLPTFVSVNVDDARRLVEPARSIRIAANRRSAAQDERLGIGLHLRPDHVEGERREHRGRLGWKCLEERRQVMVVGQPAAGVESGGVASNDRLCRRRVGLPEERDLRADNLEAGTLWAPGQSALQDPIGLVVLTGVGYW
jgi:hypothetical protein